jgi:hypothetical protein
MTGLVWFLATPLRTGLWHIPGPWWRRYTSEMEVFISCFSCLMFPYAFFRCLMLTMDEPAKSLSAYARNMARGASGSTNRHFLQPSMIEKCMLLGRPSPKYAIHTLPLGASLTGSRFSEPSLEAAPTELKGVHYPSLKDTDTKTHAALKRPLRPPRSFTAYSC